LSAPGLKSDFYDVDVSQLSFLQAQGIPPYFVAVNPFGTRFAELFHLYETNPSLARFRLLKLLLEESGLFTLPGDILLERAARRLLKEPT
ncbi:MAG: hypothetical protein GY765_29525, partial [bacterium]|nr:hypothetical protein [bacterium]